MVCLATLLIFLFPSAVITKGFIRQAMPVVADVLTAQQVVDNVAFLLTCQDDTAAAPALPVAKASAGIEGRFSVVAKPDRLEIAHRGRRVADFVFRDDRTLRPYFVNVRGPHGARVTRQHPPVEGQDAMDHATMHPGIWFGFGDINGVDLWRNKGTIAHQKFLQAPKVSDDRLQFTTLAALKSPDGAMMGEMISRVKLLEHRQGWLVVWDAEFRGKQRELVFGDQEEMGFGARVATSVTEKNGGVIIASTGQRTAGKTWGQAADWCDYTRTIDDAAVGIMLMTDPKNFRPSWWHNRDYGVFVANPFGRAAMRQGKPSQVTVPRGESLRLRFGAFAHDASGYNPADVYQTFLKVVAEQSP